uniref:Uncharacterized protein n=1 Tax=Amphimedon queenslandica TaxID=400682 RepID=A0A1X7VDM5_AMPQE
MQWQAFLVGVFWRVLFVTLLFYFGRKLLRVIGNVLYQLREHFILWNVAFGGKGTRRNVSHRLRLHAYVCKSSLLDTTSMNELFSFGKHIVDTDVTFDMFRKAVLSYKFVIICRDKVDGSLRGMCLLDKATEIKGGQKCTLIKMGLAFFENQYQGGPLLYYIVFYHILKEILFHPQTPVYLLIKCFSYKSYLAFQRTLGNVYPSYHSEIPEFERNLINDFANSVRRPDEVYNPDTFVLEREMTQLKNYVAPITKEELKNPHVKFFTERNPGWKKGHCMFVIASIKKWDIFLIFVKAIKRALGFKSEKGKKSDRLRQSFDRHLSYQCQDAQDQVLEFYNLDSSGNVVTMFGTSADINAYVPSQSSL